MDDKWQKLEDLAVVTDRASRVHYNAREIDLRFMYWMMRLYIDKRSKRYTINLFAQNTPYCLRTLR